MAVDEKPDGPSNADSSAQDIPHVGREVSSKAIKTKMRAWELCVATGVSLLSLYVFAYLLVMQTQETQVSTGGPLFTLRRPYFSQNRNTEDTLRKVFKPALFIDSKIRPGYWGLPPQL